MNRHVVIIVSLAVAVVVVLSGCNRPMSSGPIPAPKVVGTAGAPTVEPISQVTPLAVAPSGATVTPQGAAPAAAAAAPTVAPTAQAAVATVAPTAQPAAAEVATSSGEATKHTVKPGEWLFSIARQYNVSPFTLAQINNINAPYRIYPGQILTIPGSQPPSPPPPPGTCSSPYTVQAGDTVYSIARKCGKTPSAILSANNLANPNFLLVGQKLQIP
jgi:LysM repeat protein